MNKTLFTAALACILSLGGLALSADDYNEKDKVTFDSGTFSSRSSVALKIVAVDAAVQEGDQLSLSEKLTRLSTSREDGKSFGILKNGTTFIPLQSPAVVETVDKLDVSSISLGKFEQGQTFQFGFANADGSGFEPYAGVQSVKAIQQTTDSKVLVAGDPLYYAGYNSDSFYQLDFSEDPFNGNIEILVMGEPLPASTVTLLVALGLAAAFLLYKNRRQRVCAEQA